MLTIRPYRDGDEVEINRGFNEVFGLQRSVEEWRWKFPAGPEGRWIVVAVDETGQVLAQYAVVPVWVQVDGRHLRAGQPVDAFCVRKPGLIQRRLFLQTVHEFYRLFGAPDKIAFIFGFPGERHMRLGRLRLRYVEPIPLPRWIQNRARRRRGWSRHRIHRGFDPETVDRLWERCRRRYPVAAIRDGNWLGRRYVGRPGVEYLHLSAWRDGEARAWAVVRRDGQSVKWAELLWDGADPRALMALTRAATDYAREAGAQELEAWLGGDEAAEEVFADLGWERQRHPQGLEMTAVSFHPEIDGAELVRRFYLTMGDSDLV